MGKVTFVLKGNICLKLNRNLLKNLTKYGLIKKYFKLLIGHLLFLVFLNENLSPFGMLHQK